MRSSESRQANGAARRAAGAALRARGWLAARMVAAACLACTPPFAAATVGAAAAPLAYDPVVVTGTHALPEAAVRRCLAPPIPTDSLAARLRRVGRLYYDHGYVQATLTPEVAADGTLELRIREGEPARLAHLYVRGAQVIPETVVRELLAQRIGAPVLLPEVEARLEALGAEYARRGYLDAEATLERLEFEPDGAVIGIAIAEGERATLAEVSVQGNTLTRAGLVQRLAGLQTPQFADAGRIHAAPQLLRRSGLFADVGEPVLYRAATGEHAVGVVLPIVEAPRHNTVYGAVGMARDPARNQAYLTGSVDLALRNIYGTGRDLQLAWFRDARLGSRLAVAYRERYLLGWPFDLTLDLSQTVRDSSSTWQTFEMIGVVPLDRNLAFELGGALDRSVYHIGILGNTLRARAHVGMRFASLRREQDGGPFGVVEVHLESALRRNDLRGPDGVDSAHVQQTIWGGSFAAGIPLAARQVLAARGEWHVLDGGSAPVPDNELYEFGGAQTLRGYRELQFRGDRVVFGGVEYRYGNPLGARLYGFFDIGALARRLVVGMEHGVHAGAGLGLRSEVANGTFDLAFAVGEERSLSTAKVHVSLLQRF